MGSDPVSILTGFQIKFPSCCNVDIYEPKISEVIASVITLTNLILESCGKNKQDDLVQLGTLWEKTSSIDEEMQSPNLCKKSTSSSISSLNPLLLIRKNDEKKSKESTIISLLL